MGDVVAPDRPSTRDRRYGQVAPPCPARAGVRSLVSLSLPALDPVPRIVELPPLMPPVDRDRGKLLHDLEKAPDLRPVAACPARRPRGYNCADPGCRRNVAQRDRYRREHHETVSRFNALAARTASLAVTGMAPFSAQGVAGCEVPGTSPPMRPFEPSAEGTDGG